MVKPKDAFVQALADCDAVLKGIRRDRPPPVDGVEAELAKEFELMFQAEERIARQHLRDGLR